MIGHAPIPARPYFLRTVLTLDLSTFHPLITERLVLRELRPIDAEQVFAMRSDPVVMRHVARPLARSIEDAAELIAKIRGIQAANDGAQWAITLKGDDAFIGIIGFWRMQKEHYRAELGYTLMRAHWGLGLMSEAIPVVVDHGFSTLGFHSIEAITSPENGASMRVLEKNGFTREAHFKENFFWEGKFLDSVHFGRLALARMRAR